LDNWIVKKIKNQVIKLNRFLYNRKLNKFKKMLGFCGENTFIQFPVRFEGMQYISIGKNVSVNAFVHMWGQGKISIGNDCLIASHVSITSVTHNAKAVLYRETIIEKEIIIGNNVWIGSHAVILPGIKIGDNAIIAAGAIVNKDVPANTMVAGVPATLLRNKN